MAPSAGPSSSSRILLASPQSPPTSLRLRRGSSRTVGLARRGGGGCARLRLVRRGAADDEAGAAARGQQAVEEVVEDPVPGRDLVTLAACLVGLLTGVSVVLFNLSVRYPPHSCSGLIVGFGIQACVKRYPYYSFDIFELWSRIGSVIMYIVVIPTP